jgi:hypothetical protein
MAAELTVVIMCRDYDAAEALRDQLEEEHDIIVAEIEEV